MIDFARLKKFFIWDFIGSFIVAALVAVVNVLVGHSTEITVRIYETLFMVVLHSLVSLAFIWDDSKHNTFTKFSLFINTIFLLIVASFIASLFGIWKIFPIETIGHIYGTFFYIGFAALHLDILTKALGKKNYMDIVIYINGAFIGIVVIMLQPTFYIGNATTVLGEMYYRFLAAAGIIDGTLSILTIIFYKLYLHEHPEVQDVLQDNVALREGQSPREGLSIWVWILLIILFFYMLGMVSRLFRGGY